MEEEEIVVEPEIEIIEKVEPKKEMHDFAVQYAPIPVQIEKITLGVQADTRTPKKQMKDFGDQTEPMPTEEIGIGTDTIETKKTT